MLKACLGIGKAAMVSDSPNLVVSLPQLAVVSVAKHIHLSSVEESSCGNRDRES